MNEKFAAFGEVMMRLEVPGYELLSQSNQLNYRFSGSGVNVLAMMSSLGYPSSLITTLPNNALGKAALSSIRSLGITSEFIQDRGNYLGKYFLEKGFGLRPTKITYTNRLESSFNTEPFSEDLFTKVAHQIDVVHFCGITLAMGELIRKQMMTLMEKIKSQGGTIVFDCNYRSSLWGKEGHKKARSFYEDVLALADIVFMNEQDIIKTLGFKTTFTDRKNQIKELAPKVAEKYNLTAISGTHRWIHENERHSLVGYLYKDGDLCFSKRKTFAVLDRIGSGDAFAAGILHSLLMDYSQEYAINFATTAGVLAHTIVGDLPVLSEEEIVFALKNEARDVIR